MNIENIHYNFNKKKKKDFIFYNNGHLSSKIEEEFHQILIKRSVTSLKKFKSKNHHIR